jgi:thymidylate synthase (FAD)
MRYDLEKAEQLRKEYVGRTISCLDKGFVILDDFFGTDETIVRSARISTGTGVKTPEEDRKLIRYMMKHHHHTPFEMISFRFHCKMPILTARQWVRHRTSKINEKSARYSKLNNEAYLPEASQMRKQSTINKQGRGETIDKAEGMLATLKADQEQVFKHYDEYIEEDLARELARLNLPVSTYTEWYWKMDLRNLFHFLQLRLDSHAQYEIRVYAEAIYEMIKPIVPVACEAFEDYILKAHTFSREEMDILKELVNTEILKEKLTDSSLSKREKKALIKVLK